MDVAVVRTSRWKVRRMKMTPLRHGCLVLLLILPVPLHAQIGNATRVRSETFDIAYEVNEDSLPLAAVHLWYTLDRGQTWLGRRPDPDRQSPVSFRAPQEGLYGFRIVATNESGASSAAPVSGTAPHVWAFVDFTPPIVQLHSVRHNSRLGHAVLQIQWTAIDANFGPRPIEINYRSVPDGAWHTVTPEPLANTGQFDWVVPEGFRGTIGVRVTVEDEGGHRVHSQSQIVEVTRLTPASGDLRPQASHNNASHSQTPTMLSFSAQSRAQRLFDDAMQLKEKGKIAKSISRLREVVRIQPDQPEAFAEMADMLYDIGDSEQSLNAYELALRHQPTMRRALLGSARVHQQRRNHSAAARSLRMVLQQTPDDAESWLSLGDVAVFQGDELLARECYTRATQVDPRATSVITEAQKRLAVMSSVSRAYRPSGR